MHPGGIGTILADNPLLTVRHVNGNSPSPSLSTAGFGSRGCSCPQHHRKMPWIATAEEPDPERERVLVKSGVKVLHIRSTGWSDC